MAHRPDRGLDYAAQCAEAWAHGPCELTARSTCKRTQPKHAPSLGCVHSTQAAAQGPGDGLHDFIVVRYFGSHMAHHGPLVIARSMMQDWRFMRAIDGSGRSAR